MKPHKHLYLARRKMSHVIDEIYTSLLHYGSDDVQLRIVREAQGLRLFVQADFNPAHRDDVERMDELLHPAIRSDAMVEMYWELAGEDQYTSDSEMSLVGQMVDKATMSIAGENVNIELFIAY